MYLESDAQDKKETDDTPMREAPTKSFFGELIATIMYLPFLLPYGVNQMGSVLFVKLLGNTDLSLSVPICKINK